MARLLFALAVPLGLLAVAPAAPVPKAEPVPLYYPTTVGTEMVYALGVGGNEITATVTAVENGPGGAKIVTLKTKGSEAYDHTVSVSVSGVVILSDRGKKLDPPQQVLRLPAKPGDTWDRLAPDGRTFATRYVGPEDIRVRAGTFPAVKVEHLSQDGDVESVWYAPGVGLVRSRFEKVPQACMELKSLKPAGK